MKNCFTFSCFLIINTVFASSAGQPGTHLVEENTAPLFQRYFEKCRKHNVENPPVYLRSFCQEKKTLSNDMTILNLDLPPKMQINDIVDRILYGDADVLYLRNTSTNMALHLYELLQKNYTHFIHVPYQSKGIFIISKYPLRKIAVTRMKQKNDLQKDILEFAIQEDTGFHARVSTSDLSIQVVIPDKFDDNITTPILLFDMHGTLTVVKQRNQESSLIQSASRVDLLNTEVFEILPVRRSGRGNDDREGNYMEGRIDGKIGPNGMEWSASVRGGYEDDRGNYAEVEIGKNDRGETFYSGRAGHDSDK